MMITWIPGQTLEELEIMAILASLDYHHYNRTKAAESLGLSIRGLRNKIYKMREMGIVVPENPERISASVCWLPLKSKQGY